MQSVLIISKNQEKSLNEALRLCGQEGVDRFDRTVIERVESLNKSGESKTKASLGIDDVKNLQKKLYLKPFRGEKKAVIIKDAHLLTTEAQNALLKILEEPPDHTLIFLTSEKLDALLPTVLSRCTTIMLEEEAINLTEEECLFFEEVLDTLPNWEAGKSLYQAEQLSKDKTLALVWLEKMLLVTHSRLIDEYKTEGELAAFLVSYIKQLQKTYTDIKTTNVNPRLALENLFLQ